LLNSDEPSFELGAGFEGSPARAIPQSQHRKNQHPDHIWALKNVSFEVKKGETIGIIGPNGSGKSTLLKLLAGITEPTEGQIHLNGRLTALIELGAGFHAELTGRENIYLNGAILGLSKREVDSKFREIVDFAELWDFIDRPVKHYSSGMYVRLGFAVAAHTEPEILLVDEVLAVGDALFQAKCFGKFQEFQQQGRTVALVTHNVDLVTSYCNSVILLNNGALLTKDTAKSVVDRYNRLLNSKGCTHSRDIDTTQSTGRQMQPPFKPVEWQGLFTINAREDRYGTKKAEILEAGIFTPDGLPVQILERSGQYLIRIKVRHNERMPAAIVAYTIKDLRGTILCGTNTLCQNVEMGWMDEGDVIIVTFSQVIRLNAGEYLLCIGSAAYENGEYVVYDRRYDHMPLQVVSKEPRVGIFDCESFIEWIRVPHSNIALDT
jgi:teichoic acid transport system ATP-binding protein